MKTNKKTKRQTKNQTKKAKRTHGTKSRGMPAVIRNEGETALPVSNVERAPNHKKEFPRGCMVECAASLPTGALYFEEGGLTLAWDGLGFAMGSRIAFNRSRPEVEKGGQVFEGPAFKRGVYQADRNSQGHMIRNFRRLLPAVEALREHYTVFDVEVPAWLASVRQTKGERVPLYLYRCHYKAGLSIARPHWDRFVTVQLAYLAHFAGRTVRLMVNFRDAKAPLVVVPATLEPLREWGSRLADLSTLDWFALVAPMNLKTNHPEIQLRGTVEGELSPWKQNRPGLSRPSLVRAPEPAKGPTSKGARLAKAK